MRRTGNLLASSCSRPDEEKWGLTQGGNLARSNEKGLASENTVTLEPTGFADGLKVSVRRSQ